MDREVLRGLLMDQKAEFERRADALSHHRDRRPVSKQFDEQAVDTNDDEVVQNLRAEATDGLIQVGQALARLETDHFDRCQECGETISDERLKVIPFTTACRNCAV